MVRLSGVCGLTAAICGVCGALWRLWRMWLVCGNLWLGCGDLWRLRRPWRSVARLRPSVARSVAAVGGHAYGAPAESRAACRHPARTWRVVNQPPCGTVSICSWQTRTCSNAAGAAGADDSATPCSQLFECRSVAAGSGVVIAAMHAVDRSGNILALGVSPG